METGRQGENWEGGTEELSKVGEVNVHTAGLQAAQVKYEVLFLQFALGLTLTVEEAQVRKGNLTRRSLHILQHLTALES